MRADTATEPLQLDKLKPTLQQRIESRFEGAYVKGASSAFGISESAQKLSQSALGVPSEAALELLKYSDKEVDFYA